MVEDRAQFQTEAAVCSQQGSAGHFRSHLPIAQDEVGEDREHHLAGGALETPDGDPTQTDTSVMGVTREAPAATTGGLVYELKAKDQEKGEDAFDKRPAVVNQAEVGGFVAKISIVMVRFSRVSLAAVPTCHPSIIRSRKRMRHDGGNALKSQDHHEGLRTLPLNPGECGFSVSGIRKSRHSLRNMPNSRSQ
jgi:hypothetical protein